MSRNLLCFGNHLDAIDVGQVYKGREWGSSSTFLPEEEGTRFGPHYHCWIVRVIRHKDEAANQDTKGWHLFMEIFSRYCVTDVKRTWGKPPPEEMDGLIKKLWKKKINNPWGGGFWVILREKEEKKTEWKKKLRSGYFWISFFYLLLSLFCFPFYFLFLRVHNLKWK